VTIAAFVISLAAVLISFGSLLYVRRADECAERAERREVEFVGSSGRLRVAARR
jgi:hypothetical protein